ncbi:MAG: molybdopterin cofactor-binding domain-containing protein [Candidatus Dormibacteria bacterium]|jgi:isoquinoline 1-oxidoreductase|nr:isoquinoline 1-oxidoreductase [Chloroflexota bacterium]
MSATLIVNGVARSVGFDPARSLLEVLRDDLGVTGPKFGCGEGACGACVVRVGDRVVPACQTLLSQVAGQPITTVEGLAQDGRLHPVQQAWLEVGAMQCGFCTPGWLLATATLLARAPRPDETEILSILERHICRCCTYPRIRRAVRRAIELTDRPEPPPGLSTAAPIGSRVDGLRLGALPEADQDAPLDVGPAGGSRFFDILGDGLVTVVEPPTEAGVVSRGWGSPPSAWLHVAASGRVTAGIGKVEGGQGTRTALALLIVEELGVPLESVRLVMGDTDVSPFDIGTFGSRSMPDAGPSVRAAAAAARDSLCEAAADRLGLNAADVTLADGMAGNPGRMRQIAFADLLLGVRRVERVLAEVALTPPGRWRTAGKTALAQGGLAVVSGRRRFPSDLTRPGMLHGVVLRPPAYGARLRFLEARRAEAIAGVTVVREGGFVGVVAGDATTARAAVEALEATWDRSEQPSLAELEAFLRLHPIEGTGWLRPVREEAGDPDRALAVAPVRLEATYRTAYIAHAPLEPRAALAEWRDGRVTVWTGTQTPFNVRRELAEGLGVDEEAARVIVPDFGGGFGGKHGATVAIEAARLARALDRPVKVQWSRAEEFTWGHLRPAAVIDVAAGSDRGGRLSAWSMTNINSGPAALFTPYRVPNWRVVHQPAASPLPQGAYRALAATANNFARESQMDAMARRLGADPLEFRLRHLDDDRLSDVLRTVASRIGWGHGRPEMPGAGRGIAGGIEKGGRVATAAEVVVGPEGRLRVVRLVTAFDCGAVVNPDNLANQIEGAVIMGLGGALFEAIDFADGRILNASLTAYRVPRLSDVPDVEVVVCDRPDQPSVGGGETPIIGVAPAIANAIADACGVRLYALPLIPDGVVPGALVG